MSKVSYTVQTCKRNILHGVQHTCQRNGILRCRRSTFVHIQIRIPYSLKENSDLSNLHDINGMRLLSHLVFELIFRYSRKDLTPGTWL